MPLATSKPAGPQAEDRMSRLTIPVSEIFGPTLEGEGPWAGMPTYFLRVGGCDFKCLWCDTDQAVLPERVKGLPRFTQAEIWEQVRDYAAAHPGPDLLAISGGNPGLYNLGLIVDEWQASASPSGRPRKVLVETQGSRWQNWFAQVNLLTVSPKPPSSGMTNESLDAFMDGVSGAEDYWIHELGLQEGVIHETVDRRWKMIFKVVVFDEADYQFARDLHVRYPLIPFHLSTGTAMGGLSGSWVPPDSRHLDQVATILAAIVDTKLTLLERYRWLAERAMNDPLMSDVQVQVQLHCLIWGITTKGV